MSRYSLMSSEQSMRTSAVAPVRIDGETAHIQRQENAARSKLEPASWGDAKNIVAQLFTLPMANGADNSGIIGAMRMAIDGEPLWAIKESVAAFLTGRAGKGFCPSSAEFGIELRLRTDPIRERLRRASRMAKDAHAQQEPASEPMSPEMRIRVSETIARLKAASEAERVPDRPEHDQFAAYRRPVEVNRRSLPLTAEDVAGLPDAPKRGMQPIPAPSFAPFNKDGAA